MMRFTPNLPKSGRILRGVLALLLAAVALLVPGLPGFVRLIIGGSALFVGFEAVRGWCALRACGIKTRF